LNIGQDGTKPCLGAAHLEVQVITTDGVHVFHEFGQFFDVNTHACLIPTYSFPALPFGKGIQIAISIWDSTSDTTGQLASGASLPVEVKAGSADTQLELTLSRTSAQLGTIIITKPADWGAMSGVNKLQYRITPAGEPTPVRSGFFSYAPDLRADPFPLIVSALPLPAVLTEFSVQVEAYRESDLLRTWNASAWIGPDSGQNPGYINFP